MYIVHHTLNDIQEGHRFHLYRGGKTIGESVGVPAKVYSLLKSAEMGDGGRKRKKVEVLWITYGGGARVVTISFEEEEEE